MATDHYDLRSRGTKKNPTNGKSSPTKSSAPKILSDLKDQEVAEGEEVTLECGVSGQPRPEITWYMYDDVIKESENCKITYIGSTAKVVFNKEVHPILEGDYECVAENTAGTASSTMTLYLKVGRDTQMNACKDSSINKSNSNSEVDNSKKEEHSHYLYHCAVVVIIAVLLIGVFILMPGQSMDSILPSSEPLSRNDLVKQFSENLNLVKEQFPSQTKRFWQVIQAAIQSNLKLDNPAYPAIVLLALNESDVATANCVIKLLLDITKTAYTSETIVDISADALSRAPEGAAKLELDNLYMNGFDNGAKVSVLNNLEKTPSEIALLLHSYCDNENAPYKDVVLLLTVNVGRVSEMSEESIEKKLATSWNNLPSGQYEAVWSRIGNNVAILNKERVADGYVSCHL